MKNNYLLQSELATKLYDTVRKLPIIDYHNHISIVDVAKDKQFENITSLWITSDPYKHRAMRILGVPEKYITGDASDFERFEKWYNCLPRLVGNPLFDWSVMEFSTLFNIELVPFKSSAKDIYEKTNKLLEKLSAKAILDSFGIEYCAPCAMLCDDISIFDGRSFSPSLRGDDIVAADSDFITKLSHITQLPIRNIAEYEKAVEHRLIEFKKKGLIFTDHAIDNGFSFVLDDNIEERFNKLLKGQDLSQTDRNYLSSYILKALAGLYAKHGLVMQLHIGAERQTSTRLLNIAGKAGGFAAVGNTINVKSLTNFLDEVEKGGYGLPKTVLFTLNPTDNAVIATLSGSYSKDGTEAIVTQGPAWWWCDHKKGITDMLDSFSAHSVLSTFVGMTTDSRSLLSLVRHDYFRRIFCSFLAEKVEKGEYPDDPELLKDIAVKCCYGNAKKLISEVF